MPAMRDLPSGIVTFLFTDIQGSTGLLQELGDGYDLIQDRHAAIMRGAIAEGGGVAIRTEDDSFFAVFPDPVGAVHAAVAAQRAFFAEEWSHGEPLRVRMGLHTGEGRLGGDNYLGIDVNRAARIAAAAHGGQVVMSNATRALVDRDLPPGVTLRDLGEHRLKDLVLPEHLHDLAVEGLPAEFPPLRSLDARLTTFPLQLSSFVGRDHEVEAVTALVHDHRLVTLTGPGGTGKTRLGLEVARRMLPEFPDGAVFVDLSPIADPTLVPSAVAQALGLQEQAEKSPVESARAYLRELRILLVIDNFEHVLESTPVVEEVLGAGEGVYVLVTSRIALRLYGEEEFAVPTMELPDPTRLPDIAGLSRYEAVALFIERARSARRDFSVTQENAPAVAEICVRLDGLPLAIELAAVRVRVLSPGAILARLGHRLPLLTGGSRNLPERQRTLRGAIAWSHDLLEEPQRRLFAALSVFAGGATLDAAEAVANPNGELGMDTLDGVAFLADQSLLRRTEGPGEEVRLGMLETVREFAAERLAETNADEITRRHAEYFLKLSVEGKPHFTGADAVEWLDRFQREHDNVRTALRWAIDHAEVETALRLVGSLWRFWFQRGHLIEGYRWAREAVALSGVEALPGALAAAELAAGGLAYWPRPCPAWPTSP
jgi:predicted ATPase/class 3 adenylate cyclase